MKTFIFLAVLLGALSIAAASTNRRDKLLNALQQLKLAEAQSMRDSLVEKQDYRDVLAQAFISKLENEVQKQDMDDEERAEMESLISRIKQKFSNLRNKFRAFGGKVKRFFHG